MRRPSWKMALVMAVAVTAVLLCIPNLFQRSTLEELPGFMPQRQITLGLDLQGGAQLLVEVQTAAVLQTRLETLLGDVRTALREARIGYRELGLQGEAVTFTLTDPSQATAARSKLAENNPLMQTTGFGAGTSRELAIDDGGNGRFSLTLTEPARQHLVNAAITQSLEVIRRRIDELGTREASVQQQGADRILVQVPGERNPERIKSIIGQTAQLTFHMVNMDVGPDTPVPAGFERLPAQEGDGPENWVVDRRVEVSGENLTDAQPSFQDNQPVVSFRFDSAGARKFGRITQDNVGKLFAIVLDDKVISAPRIREPILGGSGVISGSFTVESANSLAILLRAGALPAPLRFVEERSVGPELGADSIRAGAIATVIASALVVGYMLMYYGIFGVFADLALLLNIVLILAIMSMLEATLTLPGIAGIVLTIGTAVDSNVLIYERIREEARNGRTPLSAVNTGFSEALRTIIDANVTTLIAAVALFQFGTGPIKGFAVTLAFGILANMFTSVTFTRVLVDTWLRRRRPAAIPL